MSLSAAVSIILVLLLSSEANAFPTGAGSCSAGTDALLQPGAPASLRTHAILQQVGTGLLLDFGLMVLLDGVVLNGSSSSDFTYGEAHKLSLMANNGMDFRGFLIRMEATDGARTIGALQPIAAQYANQTIASGGVQVSALCQSVEFVAGVTHTDRIPKNQVNITLTMPTASQGLLLDVTTVIRCDETQNISQWYYSRYMLNAVAPPGATTPIPTALVPAPKPSTTPTNSTHEPSVAPVSMPAPSGAMAHAWGYHVSALLCIIGGVIWTQ